MTATLPSLLTSAFLHLSLHVYWYWELLQLQCLSLFSFNLLFYYLCQIPKSLNHLVHSLMIESCLPMQSYLLAKEHFFHILTLRVWGQARFRGKETPKIHNHLKCPAVDNEFHYGKTKCEDKMGLFWDIFFKRGSG